MSAPAPLQYRFGERQAVVIDASAVTFHRGEHGMAILFVFTDHGPLTEASHSIIEPILWDLAGKLNDARVGVEMLLALRDHVIVVGLQLAHEMIDQWTNETLRSHGFEPVRIDGVGPTALKTEP